MFFSHDDLLVYFSNKQTYRVFDRELCQYYSQYKYLKSIHYHIVFKKDADWKCQEKEANNQEDEISEQSLQSQRTERYGECMWFSSL